MSTIAISVTPFAGVWIEINSVIDGDRIIIVTPFAGVWIEILREPDLQRQALSHSLRGSVD